jgi:hypothetical protein
MGFVALSQKFKSEIKLTARALGAQTENAVPIKSPFASLLHVHQGLSTTLHGALRQLNEGQSRQELSWDLKKKLCELI